MARTNATAEVSLWHFLIGSFLLAALGLGLGLGLTRGTGDGAPHLAVIAPTPTPTPSPTPTVTTQPTPTTVPTPEPRIIRITPQVPEKQEPTLGSHGMILVGDTLNYTVNSMFTPPGIPPNHHFPLYLARWGDGRPKRTIIATIPDPGIQEVGDRWQSDIIADPDFPEDPEEPRYLLRMSLEKVAQPYTYNVEFQFSPDNGANWLSVLIKEVLLYPN